MRHRPLGVPQAEKRQEERIARKQRHTASDTAVEGVAAEALVYAAETVAPPESQPEAPAELVVVASAAAAPSRQG